MKTKKLFLTLIALLAMAAILLAGCTAGGTTPSTGATEPSQTQPSAGVTDPSGESKTEYAANFTVIVVHKDGTEKTFTYGTNEEYLGPVLVAEGLLEEPATPGFYDTVDGEKADWSAEQSYWAFYVGEDYASKGLDETPIHDGDTFKLIYTVG